MLVLDKILDMHGSLGRLGFLLWFVALSAYMLFAPVCIFQWLADNHHFHALSLYIGILIAADGFCGLWIQTNRRFNTLGRLNILTPLILLSVLALATWLPPLPPTSYVTAALLSHPVLKISVQVLGVALFLFLLLSSAKKSST